MIRALSFCVVSGVAMLVAVPAYAQLNSSALAYSSAPRESSNSDILAALNQEGSCLANTKREESEAFVSAVIDSQAETDDLAPCLPLGRDVTIDPTDAHFAIAEAGWRAATGRPTATIQGRD